MPTAFVMAGIPAINRSLYRTIRFVVGDPVAFVRFDDGARTLILRDIEMDRAKRHARADRVSCPRDFEPAGGLSGDRETATAQALAECLRRGGVTEATSDRTLPLIYAEHLRHAGIRLRFNPDLGVADRRAKDAQEVAFLREAQAATETAMRRACELVARASARADGVLEHDGAPLTSDRVRYAIDVCLLELGYENPKSIVAGGPIGADCHDYGHGELRTGEPVIVDIFPRNRTSLYNGDCTRTVVHGDVSPEVARMHEAVVAAKHAAQRATRAGVTGEDVHRATLGELTARGFAHGQPPADAPLTWCGMTHGTGHGIGLDVHEPPLLDFKGLPLVEGDALTIEPGLYARAIGGIRVEDLVIVRADGCENLNALHEGLDWR
ncbi:MAG: aminopeptidase P family protein [Phycisphaerae bacterium]|nr:aminopeptidase P family protein [Phycisphaerae bacterium]